MKEADTADRLLTAIRLKRDEESRLRSLMGKPADTFEELARVGELMDESRALIRAHADVIALCCMSLVHDHIRQQNIARESASSLDKAIETLRALMARRQ